MRSSAIEEETYCDEPVTQTRFSHRQVSEGERVGAPHGRTVAEPSPLGLAIRKHCFTLIAFTIVPAAISGFALSFVKPMYSSTARLIVQHAGGGLVIGSYSAKENQQFLQTEQQIITSTPVLAAALGASEIATLDPIRGHADSIRQLKGALRVEPGDGQNVLTISCDSSRAKDSARVVSAVVEAYVRFQSGIRGKLADGSQAVVQREKDDAVERFQEKWGQLQKFARDHGIADGHEQVDAADAALHDLAIKLARAKVEVQSTRAAAAEVESQVNIASMQDRIKHLKETDPAIITADEQVLVQKIGQLQSTLASYGARFMSNYPAVQTARRQIEDLQMARVTIFQQRQDAAIRRQNELETAFAEQQQLAVQSANDLKQYETMKSETVALEAQVHLFDNRLRELDPATRALTTSVTVLEPAVAADRPSSPRWGIVLGLAAMAGLSLGSGVIAIGERRSLSRTATGSPLLGAGLTLLARLPAVPRRQLSPNADRLGEAALEFAEACERIQLALENMSSTVGGLTVLITSADPREGKSTLASLLGSALARTGKRVLLIDANLPLPAQAGVFGIEAADGLANLLSNDGSIELSGNVHPTADDTLDVLPAGRSDESSDALLDSPRFSNVLASAAQEYDFVLIDSPAVSEGSDAQIISSSCDTTILLAREKNLNRKTLTRTIEDLRNVGGAVIGVVLNGGCEAIKRGETVYREAYVNVDVSQQVQSLPVMVVRRPTNLDAEHVAEILEPVLEAGAELRSIDRTSLWSKALLLGLVLGGWVVFHFMGHSLGAGAWQNLPQTLAIHAPWLFTLPTVACGLAGVIVIAAFIVKPPAEDVGMLCVVSLLGTLSLKGGAGDAIGSVGGSGGAVTLALETGLLFAGLLLVRSVLRGLFPRPIGIEEEPASLGDTLLAMFAQVSVMAALIILLSRMDSKIESLAVIGFASCLATMAGSWVAPFGSNKWFWMSPLGVAVVGYLAAAAVPAGAMPELMQAGLAALAHPLPLDYASMGPLGALAGYWIASTGRSDQTTVFVK